MKIAVAVSPQLSPRQLIQLAERVSLPLYDNAGDYAYLLYQTARHLELRSLIEPQINPLYVDFTGGKNRHRRLYGGGRGQHLARAIGLKKHPHPVVVDATAGLGRDAFVLATLGCRVTMLERSAVIAALLRDGLQHAQDAVDDTASKIAQRMQLVHADAISWLESNSRMADVIYLDPMFPGRKKSAQVKKEMRIFQDIVGRDQDVGELFGAALDAAGRRVVVKRPVRSGYVEERRPDFSITGKTTRYDVYLIHDVITE
ncbi:MAG: class I SAM-dependent methyltransferase [Gammaproteobacteria bacterium]|nr:class I SAM-dependent methyltransferase [Gammaproteobacteria bacterium]